MGRSFKSNLMFIYNQPYVLAQSTLCLFQTIRCFFMQMTARLFIIMHINSRLYAYLFLSLLIYQKIEIAKIGK